MDLEQNNQPWQEPGEASGEDAVYYEEEVVVTQDAGAQAQPDETPAPTPAPQAQRPAREKKPWNKRIAIAAAAAVVVLALIVILVVSAVGNSPLKLVAESIGNQVSTLENSQIVDTARKALSGGSISVQAPMNDLGQALLFGYVDPVPADGTGDGMLSVKTYADLPEQKMAVLTQMPFMGETFEAGIYGNAEAVALDAPTLLPGVYGVNLKTLVDTLPQSVFAPDSGSGMALDEETYTQVMQQLAQMNDDAVKQNQAFIKQLQKLDRKATAELFKCVEAYAEIEKDSGEVQFIDSSARVTVVSVRADGPALVKIYRDMLQWMLESKDVEQTVNSFCELYGAQVATLYGTQLTAQDLPEEFYDGLYDQLDACADLEEAWEDVALALDFHITKSGRRLVKVEAEVADVYGDETRIVATAGPTLADPELIQIQYSDAWQDAEILYGVENSDAKQYSARLRVKQNNQTVASASVSWDKKDGDLRLKYENEDEDETVLLKGSMLWEKKTLTVNIRSITYDEDIVKPDLTISVCTEDKMPDMPEYAEALLLSEEEFTDLGTQVQQNLMALMNAEN